LTKVGFVTVDGHGHGGHLKSRRDRKGSRVSLSFARQLAVEGALHPERLPPPLNFGLNSSLVDLPRRGPRVTTHLKDPSKGGTPITRRDRDSESQLACRVAPPAKISRA